MTVFRRGASYCYDFWYRQVHYRGTFGPVTREDAVQAESLLKRDVAQRVLFAPRPKSWAWHTQEFLIYTTANCRPKTLESRLCHLKTLAPHFSTIPLDQLKPEQIEHYKQHRLERGVTKNTINAELKILRQIVNRAYEAGYLTEPPIRRWRMLPLADTGRTRILTPDEEARLLFACPPQMRVMVTLALHTGMRGGEICRLRWEHVNVMDRLIRIPAEGSKNGKEGLVPMNATVVNLLASWKPGPEAEGSVFGQQQMWNTFQRVALRAGLPDVVFHSLRHTFASRLAAAGIPLVDDQGVVATQLPGDDIALYAPLARSDAGGGRTPKRPTTAHRGEHHGLKERCVESDRGRV